VAGEVTVANEIESIILPALYAHLSTPAMKKRLRMFPAWVHSFEKWFQWEAVFALDPIIRQMHGVPWDYEAWDIEVTRRHKHRHKGIIARKQVDMVFRGAKPLFLEFKVYMPGFCLKWLNADSHSVLADIRWVRSVRDATGVAMLLALETHSDRLDFARLGMPAPVNTRPPKIHLGKALGPESTSLRETWASFYYWSNMPTGRSNPSCRRSEP
jgi:hypothetical protein